MEVQKTLSFPKPYSSCFRVEIQIISIGDTHEQLLENVKSSKENILRCLKQVQCHVVLD